MKKFFTLFAFSAFACIGIASAQATVESATPQEQVTFANEIKTEKEAPAFQSEAQIKAEKAALRKERNTIEFNATLNGSLAYFNDKWLSVNGNTNSLTGIGNVLFTHTYTKGKFTIGTKVTGKLGYAFNFTDEEQKNTVSKSQDEWFIQTSPAYVISKSWNVGGSASLRSQFANGWSSTDKESRKLTSSGFAPAYLIASLGVTYVCQNKKFYTIVSNDQPGTLPSVLIFFVKPIHILIDSAYRYKRFLCFFCNSSKVRIHYHIIIHGNLRIHNNGFRCCIAVLRWSHRYFRGFQIFRRVLRNFNFSHCFLLFFLLLPFCHFHKYSACNESKQNRKKNCHGKKTHPFLLIKRLVFYFFIHKRKFLIHRKSPEASFQ